MSKKLFYNLLIIPVLYMIITILPIYNSFTISGTYILLGIVSIVIIMGMYNKINQNLQKAAINLKEYLKSPNQTADSSVNLEGLEQYGFNEVLADINDLKNRIIRSEASETENSIRVMQAVEIIEKELNVIDTDFQNAENELFELFKYIPKEDSHEIDNNKRSVQFNKIADTKDRTLNALTVNSGDIFEITELIKKISNSSDNMQDILAELKDSLGSIEIIVDDIQNITKQTNILALNASIEAARAGKYGAGFSIVAEEIRKLADQSRNSSDTISKIISNVQNVIEEVTKTKAKGGDVVGYSQDKSKTLIENTSIIKNDLDEFFKELKIIIKDMDRNPENIEYKDSFVHIQLILDNYMDKLSEMKLNLKNIHKHIPEYRNPIARPTYR